MSKDTAPLLPFSRLPDLLERLYDSLASFLEAKLTLFRKEIWEEGQSLVRRGLGVAAAVHIGVRTTGRFEAHAWVECDGVAVTDASDVEDRFATILSS